MTSGPMEDFLRQVEHRLGKAESAAGQAAAAAGASGDSGAALVVAGQIERIGRDLLNDITEQSTFALRRGTEKQQIRAAVRSAMENYMANTQQVGRQSDAFGGSYNSILDEQRTRLLARLLAEADAAFLDQDVAEAAEAPLGASDFQRYRQAVLTALHLRSPRSHLGPDLVGLDIETPTEAEQDLYEVFETAVTWLRDEGYIRYSDLIPGTIGEPWFHGVVLTAKGEREHLAESPIPASDRLVPLDHNSPQFEQLVSALNSVEEALRGWNGYFDEDEKERTLAEVEAGKALLKPKQARLDALVAVLVNGLKAMLKKAADSALAKLIDTALAIALAYLRSKVSWMP